MRVIIAGPRDLYDYPLVEEIIKESGFSILEVVSGGATGVDSMGEIYAMKNDIPIKRFEADWDKYGKSAGPIRNQLMAEYAEALIAVDKQTPGTTDMIRKARKQGLKVYTKRIK